MGNIKGITIEIGSDTKKFKSGLAELNKSAKDLQNELKYVNQALKHDPKNTDLLRQKQELLTKSVSETKSKLESLKAAKEKADKDMANGTEVNQEQYRRLVREISTTENSLKNLTKVMKNFGSVSAQQIAAAGEDVQELGGKIETVGKKVSVASAASAAALGASVKLASDYTDAVAKVGTVADLQSVPLEKLRDDMLQLSTETGRGAGEIADATYQAISASVDTADAVSFVGTSVGLAKAGFLETADAVDVLTTIINAYGLEASDAGRLSDILIQTQNDGKTTVNELSQSMGQVIPLASAYGVNIENLAASYAQLTKNGVATAQAGTYLKSMLNELGDSGSDVGEILKSKTGKSFGQLMNDGMSLGDVLGILNDSVNGDSEALAGLWSSSEAGTGALSILSSGVGAFNDELGNMQDSTGNVADALETLSTPSAKAQESLNAVKNAGIELGSAALEAIAPLLEQLAETVKSLTERFSNLSPATQTVIVAVMAILAALGPVIIIIGTLIQSIGAIMTIAPAVATALGTVKIAIAAIGGPVTIVIAVITALVLKLIHAYNTSEEFRNKVNAVFDAVGNKVNAAINRIIGVFQSGIAYYKNAVSDIKAAWSELVSWFSGKVSDFVSIGKNVLMGLWNGINDKVGWLKGKVKGVVDKIKSWFTGKDGFDTHSPSKWSEKICGFVMQGLAIRFEKDNVVAKAARAAIRKIKAVITGEMDTIPAETVKSTAEKIKTAIADEIDAVNAEISRIQKEAEDERAKEELAQYKENLAKKQAELKKAEPKNRKSILDEIAKLEKDWNKKQLEAARTAEQQKLQERLTALQEFKQKYESELSAIEQKESSLSDKLFDYGELFTRVQDENSEKEIFKLTDLDESIKKIQQYNEQIEKLKEKGLSSGLLSEIADMNIEDALDFTEKLDRLEVGKFEEYVEKFEEKRRLANEAAQQFYSEEMEELAMNAVEQAKSYAEDFNDVGKALTDGVADGIKDGKSSIVNAIVKAIRDAIKAAKDEAGMGDGGSDGSHRTGLREVPFDGYRAILHKGERVLTQPEAERYKKGNEGNRTENFNVYIGTVENKDERTTEDFMREMEFYRKRRVSAVGGAV
ncbi:MAG TPA: phage tail tape measure protein [Tyzzerella sp.]|nr:phage tail tape measure protein [Tyzzerella sp.]